MSFTRIACAFGAAVLGAAQPATAADVVLTGLVVNSCTLTITTPGALAPAVDGMTLASDQTGGVTAVLSLVAAGTQPTVSFSAPTLAGPTGFSGTPTTEIRYTSTSGAMQTYTSMATSAPVNGLIDTFSVNGRVTSASGFASGQYTVTTVATCQQ